MPEVENLFGVLSRFKKYKFSNLKNINFQKLKTPHA